MSSTTLVSNHSEYQFDNDNHYDFIEFTTPIGSKGWKSTSNEIWGFYDISGFRISKGINNKIYIKNYQSVNPKTKKQKISNKDIKISLKDGSINFTHPEYPFNKSFIFISKDGNFLTLCEYGVTSEKTDNILRFTGSPINFLLNKVIPYQNIKNKVKFEPKTLWNLVGQNKSLDRQSSHDDKQPLRGSSGRREIPYYNQRKSWGWEDHNKPRNC
ncbi:uncharacterized protein I206_104776 [Kwoniella pini CBS 10737]|uniref:Uncharacterized protein n=1 Tax=Kwoniella pini CBS 10737 TaxID=1296096 RepID=A0A1B9I7S6_9TREE|nr:uncharacterized protein I206_02315 [Kwoniella pini CBS 10737]OCF51600.1 hypothetical protein I206_02315 [Kwoniella pini CBS 10737]